MFQGAPLLAVDRKAGNAQNFSDLRNGHLVGIPQKNQLPLLLGQPLQGNADGMQFVPVLGRDLFRLLQGDGLPRAAEVRAEVAGDGVEVRGPFLISLSSYTRRKRRKAS